MLTALAVSSLLAAAPVKSLAAPGFQCANIDIKVVDSFVTHFTQQLAGKGFQVTTPAEVTAVLGLERQKQLLACSEEGCDTEIASALGVDALITGSIGKIGSGYLLNIKIIRAKDASALAVFSARPKTDDQVLDFLEASAQKFADQYPPPTKSALAVGTERPVEVRPSPRVLPWVVAGAGVASLAVGGVFLGLAQGTANDLRAGKGATYDELQKLQSSGRTQETVGIALLGVGAALAATGVGLYLFGGSGSTQAALVPTPTGFAFTVGGAL